MHFKGVSLKIKNKLNNTVCDWEYIHKSELHKKCLKNDMLSKENRMAYKQLVYSSG